MKVYKVSHNIEHLLGAWGESKVTRCFQHIFAANVVYEAIAEDFYRAKNDDRYITLEEVTIRIEDGEYKESEGKCLRWLSDDMMIGGDFDPFRYRSED